MNNFEKIKNMTIDEMAEFVFAQNNGSEYSCEFCPKQEWCIENYPCWRKPSTDICIEGVKQWLLSEVENEHS